MRIGINVLPLSTDMAGAQRYARSIIQGLVERDKKNIYVLFLSQDNAKAYAVQQDNVCNIIVPITTKNKIARIVYEQLFFPFLVRKHRVDVLFSPCNIAPWFGAFRKVTMIFDMHWFVETRNMSRWRLWYTQTLIKHTARCSDALLTISEHSKNDIVRFTGVNPQKITVTFLGETPLFALKKQIVEKSYIQDICQQHKIRKPYVLFIGQLLHRKNVDLVVRALAMLKNEHGVLPFQFVVAGHWAETPTYSYGLLQQLIVEEQLDDAVIFVHHPQDDVLADLLAHARLFVYPSLYEGYGLPVAEAMHFGVPVITSNVSSLPEVGQDACYYVDPTSVAAMAEALWILWHDERQCRVMIEKGLFRVSKLSWNDSVVATHKVLQANNEGLG